MHDDEEMRCMWIKRCMHEEEEMHVEKERRGEEQNCCTSTRASGTSPQ